MAHLFRALMLRAVVVLMPLAVICTYGNQALSLPRLVTAAVTPTAAIDQSHDTIGMADSSLYGQSPEDIAKTLDTLQSIGVQNVRVYVPWAFVEPTQGTYNWSAIDEVMNAAKARNMGVLAVVNSTPLWAAPSGTLPGAGAPSPSDYADFMKQVATRYLGTVSAYEVWNEPNCVCFYQPTDPASYTELLKTVYPVLKQIDPTLTVVAGALGSVISFGGITMDPVEFVKQMYANGAQGFFDALSFHPYQETTKFSDGGLLPNSPLNQVEGIRALMVQNGDSTKLIWVSEYGLPTENVSQQTQADFIGDLINAWRALTYTGPVFIYTTRDGTPGSGTYGIYQADWTPKLAVAVIKQAIADAMAHNPVTSPIVALGQWIQAVVGQVQQALASFTTALQNAVANAIKAVTDALTAVFHPVAALSTTSGAATAVEATAGGAALLAARTSAAELQTQVAETKVVSEAGATGTVAGEKAADETKAVDTPAAGQKVVDAAAVDPKATDPKASDGAAADPKAADPKSTEPVPAGAVVDGTKGATTSAAGTEAPDKTGATPSEPTAETPKADGTKADGTKTDGTKTDGTKTDGTSGTSDSDATQSDSTKSGAPKTGSQSGTSKSEDKSNGQSGTAANPKNDTKDSGTKDGGTKDGGTKDSGNAGHGKSDGKSDGAKTTTGTSSASSGVKAGHAGGQSGSGAAAGTDAGKSDSSKSVDTSSGNKHSPRAVGEPSKPAGRANNDAAAKDSSASAGSTSHENQGS